MPDVKAKIDLDLGDLKDRLDEFTSSLQDAVDIMDQWHDVTIEKSDYMKQAYAGMAEGVKDINKEQETSTEKTKKANKEIKKSYEEVIATMRKEGGIGGIIAQTLPAQSQILGIQNSIGNFKKSILSELPFGGLIGLMVLGGKREEEVRAMGATVGRVFQQAGQAGRREMGLIGRDVRRLGIMLGKGPTGLAGEAASAAAAFAQAGIDIETVVRGKFSEPIKGSRGSILEASMAIDALFKQASGTAARQMGELIRDFNQSAQESTRIIASVGLVARDSGTSVAAFTGSVMRSAQALRTQRVDIEEVAEAQLRFQKLLEREMPDVTRQFAAGYAERAIGQVTQGLAGMSVGLSAVIGERISRRVPGMTGGQQVTGLEAYYALREGFRGRGQRGEQEGMFVESVRELLSLAQENGRTVEEQRFFLERMGFGFEGAKAIVKVGQDTAKGTDLQDAIKNNQKDLNRAFISKAEETSAFQRSLLKIQNGIAKVGAGLLAVTIAGIQSLINIGTYIGGMLFGNKALKAASWEALGESAEMSSRGIKVIMGGLEEALGGLKLGTMTTLGLGGGAMVPFGERLTRHRTRQSEIARGEVYGEIGGKELFEDITKSELRTIAEQGREEVQRRKQIGVGGVLKRTTLAYEDISALQKLYERGERETGRGEQAVYEAIKSKQIYEEGRRVSPQEVLRRMRAEERRQEERAEVAVPGGGKMKVKVIVEALEGPKGLPEGG